MSNWKKTLLTLLVLLFLIVFPPTKHLIMFLLPLGSGIDDLIFFILLFALIIVALIRLGDIETVIANLKKWFSE